VRIEKIYGALGSFAPPGRRRGRARRALPPSGYLHLRRSSVARSTTEIDAAPYSLLVVTGDLVSSTSYFDVRHLPREILVQLCPDFLRQPLVGGVANEGMLEAEAVLSGIGGSRGPDQVLAHERHQIPTDRRPQLRWAEVDDLPADELLPDDGGALDYGTLVSA
jgi:hypothetical protein